MPERRWQVTRNRDTLHRMIRMLLHAVVLTSLVLAAGCKSKPAPVEKIDYARPLGPGESALRKITDPARLPDMAGAFQSRDEYLLDALDQSLIWFKAPSSRQFFPFESITHEQAEASVLAFRELLGSASNAASFAAEITQMFDVYESVGYNGAGIVLYTGYYAPVFDASLQRTAEFAHPLYKRPADLVTDQKTGTPLGRRTASGRIEPYPTRSEIESSGMLKGTELVWLKDALSAYVVQVNGSAKLRMPDGSILYIGYNGKTDRPYTGLGKLMVDEGVIPADQLSLPAIRQVFQQDPNRVLELIKRNESYVFFTEYDGGNWPAGSLGVKVNERASLATDKKIYPRGGVVLVDTDSVSLTRGKEKFLRFLLDQDTGGAIQAPGRADIFMGVGPTAEILAGGQYAEGRLYYFILKAEHVNRFLPSASQNDI